ncbi:carboxypeptidase M32, partial [bacterium]
QDIHWAHGFFGYFPSYAVGGAIAAQLFESLRTQVTDIDEQIARGDFTGLTGWLAASVHGQGARLGLQDLVKHATGKTLSAAPTLRYLEHKYLEEAA